MSFDNRIFNINGNEDEHLLAVLKLAFAQKGTTCKGTFFDVNKGLILLWWCDKGDKGCPLPVPLTAEECFPIIKSWLKGEQAASMKCEGWDADADHDGDNSMGWRVYCEDWGHVADISYALCAVRPAFMWHGK